MVSRKKKPEVDPLPDMDVRADGITYPNEPTQHAPTEAGPERSYAEEQNPRAWFTDVAAGVELRTSRDPYQAQLVFTEGKPSDEIRTFVKSQGFRWNPDTAAWTRPIQYATAAQDRETGRRVVGDVAKMLRQEKGIEASAERTPF